MNSNPITMFHDTSSDSLHNVFIDGFLQQINLSESKLKINPLNDLLSFIRKSLSTPNELSSSLKKRYSNLERNTVLDDLSVIEKKFGAVIVKKMSLLNDLLFSKHAQAMYWHMLEKNDLAMTDNSLMSDENILLAKLMFGKTIAKTCSNTLYAAQLPESIIHQHGIEVNKPFHKGEYDFPVDQHNLWYTKRIESSGGYHRWSLPTDISNNSAIIKAYSHPILQGYTYIPIIIFNNCPIKNIVANYFSIDKNLIEMITDDAISLMKIPAVNYDKNENNIKEYIKYCGMIASPWEISKYIASKRHMEQSINDKADNINHTAKITAIDMESIENMLSDAPNTIIHFKETPLMAELMNLSRVFKGPVKNLASCAYELISAVQHDWHGDPQTIKRMYLFLSLAVMFNRNHYERFAFLLYAIMHEISLILNHAIKSGIEVTNYQNFKKNISSRFNDAFDLGISDNVSKHYDMIAAPANSGCHACLMALEFSRNRIRSNKNPVVLCFNTATYYEITPFINITRHSSDYHYLKTDEDELADIYFISSGPISHADKIYPGIDINSFIKELVNNGLDVHPHEITIIIDTTSGLNETLKLNEMTLKLLNKGKISLICAESFQKFGLAHTDQVQSGVVYNISKKNLFDQNVIDQFQENAEKDFINHIDTIITNFIHENIGHHFEKIKKKHFRNGAIFKTLLKNESVINNSTKDNNISLFSTRGLLFNLINEKSDPNLLIAAFKNFDFRQGFGHYNTTICHLVTKPGEMVIRLNPGGSDKIDTLIQAVQLNLSSQFSREQLFYILGKILDARKNLNLYLQIDQEIFYTALLMSLKNLVDHPPQPIGFEKSLLMDGINDLSLLHSPYLSARKSLQTLYQFAKSPRYFTFYLRDFIKYLEISNENEKLELIKIYQSENVISQLLEKANGRLLLETIKIFPEKLRFDLALQWKHLINKPDIYLQILNLLPDNTKYSFIKNTVLSGEPELLLSNQDMQIINEIIHRFDENQSLMSTNTQDSSSIINLNTLFSHGILLVNPQQIDVELKLNI